MGQLGKTQSRLLRQVNNQQHATDADHHADALPTPPASNDLKNGRRGRQEETEEDLNRDPDSSSDEESQQLPTAQTNGPTFQHTRHFDGAAESETKPNGFRKPAMPSLESTRSNKRGSEEASSGSDDMIFSSQTRPSPSKRKKSASSSQNIHVAAGAHRTKRYGRFGSRPVPRVPHKALQRPNAAKSLTQASEEKRPTFKVANVFSFGEDESNAGGFKAARGVEDASRASSPSLDELSSADSDIEEIDVSTLGLPMPEPYVATETCEICGYSVPQLLRREFEDQYTSGKAMSYKWQERFCRYHKVDSARQVWTERGYPEIDWLKFDRRLKRHHKHIEAILKRKTPSFYRDKLQAQVDSGKTKTTHSAFGKTASKSRDIAVGYYGPRGEKLMTDHVINHFGDELRTLSTDDPLLKASGVAGGVSGFVQAVLVPELAVKLVMEDMKITSEKAREILVESADLGELVNEEAKERVEDVDADAADKEEDY